MNYLAHLYLSGKNEDVLIGNFIADSVKGSKYKDYSIDIQRGVVLHRQIDTHTDAHPNFKQAAQLFFPTHRHYSRVLVDMYFDHLLARDWLHYHPQKPLPDFARDFYSVLNTHIELLPKNFQKINRIIREQDWFNGYARLPELEQILMHMDRRTRFDSQLQASVAIFKHIQSDFEALFPPFCIDLRAATLEERIRVSCTA